MANKASLFRSARPPVAGEPNKPRRQRRRHVSPQHRRFTLPLLLTISPLLTLLLLNHLNPFPHHTLDRPPATTITDRNGDPLRFFLPPDGRWRLPVDRDELPDDLVAAVVASEDRWFYRHPGVNPLAIVRATWQNLRAGRVISGGSTLTMQIARMARPAPRTVGAKLREALRALQLERRYDKDELIELYLDLAPFGGNLEGVGAASFFYFGKRPEQLSIGEIALLVALPRSPSEYDPTRDPATARAARDRVLAQLAERGGIGERAAAEAMRQPLPVTRRSAPFTAPHFARWAAAQAGGATRLATTLDRGVQLKAEEQVRRRLLELRPRGIGNAAVVVVERSGRELRALVGSGGFFESAFDGQVNGATARRSPGSTLKPLLYALALERGEVVPETYLLDVPTDFAGYVAENYDGLYRGRVTVRQALTESLNAPAVRLLSRVGLTELLDLLRSGGLTTLDRPAGEYGLPLVLGAGEVTLLDLTNLYATLAEGGLHQPIRWSSSVAPAPVAVVSSQRLFSPEAAWQVTEILREVRRPDLPAAWRLATDVPAVAWKTGTSYGHRDAWAVGFSGKYAIGVWVGNFDGRPRHGISGAEDAAPLLFDLFRALEPAASQITRPAGLRIESVEVCPGSRRLAHAWCPGRIAIDYLPHRSRLDRCSLHRRVRVAASADAMPRWAVTTDHPPALVAWWRDQGRAVPEAVPTLAALEGIPSGTPPRIVSPDAATPYRLRADAPLAFQKIPLTARAAADTRRLFWYQDGVLVASGAPAERLFLEPRRGRHRLVVTDDLGRSDALTYAVE